MHVAQEAASTRWRGLRQRRIHLAHDSCAKIYSVPTTGAKLKSEIKKKSTLLGSSPQNHLVCQWGKVAWIDYEKAWISLLGRLDDDEYVTANKYMLLIFYPNI
jgi:hypothetical protein